MQTTNRAEYPAVHNQTLVHVQWRKSPEARTSGIRCYILTRSGILYQSPDHSGPYPPHPPAPEWSEDRPQWFRAVFDDVVRLARTNQHRCVDIYVSQTEEATPPSKESCGAKPRSNRPVVTSRHSSPMMETALQILRKTAPSSPVVNKEKYKPAFQGCSFATRPESGTEIDLWDFNHNLCSVDHHNGEVSSEEAWMSFLDHVVRPRDHWDTSTYGPQHRPVSELVTQGADLCDWTNLVAESGYLLLTRNAKIVAIARVDTIAGIRILDDKFDVLMVAGQVHTGFDWPATSESEDNLIACANYHAISTGVERGVVANRTTPVFQARLPSERVLTPTIVPTKPWPRSQGPDHEFQWVWRGKMVHGV